MEVKTKSERFVESRRSQWESLHDMLNRIARKGLRSLNDKEAREFPRIYRLACADYAEAKMLNLSPDVIYYLNSIIGQAHKCLYGFPPIGKSSIIEFFTANLPWIIIRNFRFVLISAFIFLASFLTAHMVILDNPQLARAVLPDEVLRLMEESYREGVAGGSMINKSSMMASYYIQHNISIAFYSFAAGILLGIGTIYLLLFNGITLGAISGYIVSLGHGENFRTFVTAHSVMELSGLILAGAAGLLLGYSIINGNKYYRKDWLNLQKGNLFTLVAGAAILIFCAAFIEGFISPSLLRYSFKAGVAVISFLILAVYFFIIPTAQSRRSGK